MATAMATSTVRRVLSTNPLATMASQSYTGIVVSAGKMDKTVKVRIPKQRWNRKIQKYFDAPISHLVHDPNNSCREGDVVSIRSGWRTAKRVRHVVTGIVAPMGLPISQRPHVPTEEERLAAHEKWRAEKDARQAARGRKEAMERIRLREKEEKTARFLENRLVQRRKREEGKEKGGAVVDEARKELEMVLQGLKREKYAANAQKLGEAMDALKAVYMEAKGVQQRKLWMQPWMRAILGDEECHARVIGMMREGKWGEDDVLAEGVDIGEYWKGSQMVTHILGNASNHAKAKLEVMWEGVVDAADGQTELVKMKEAAKQRAVGFKNVHNFSLKAAEELAQSWEPVVSLIRNRKCLSLEGQVDDDLAQPLLILSDTLDDTTTELTKQLTDAAAPFYSPLSGMKTALSRMTKRSQAIQAQMDAAPETHRLVLRLAKDLYDTAMQQLQARIQRSERTDAFVERYPLVAENNDYLKRVLANLGWPKAGLKEALKDTEAEGVGVTEHATVLGTEQVGTDSDGLKMDEVSGKQKDESAAKAQSGAAIAHEAVDAQRTEAEKLESGAKELPPSSELPGGKRAVDPINERALHNKRQAMKFEEMAIENEGEARELAKEADEEAKNQVGEEKREEIERKSGSLFGWFRKS